jgi:hypothetical protein
MAKLRASQIIHSDDALKIILNADPKKPEPRTVVVDIPTGHVEVSRCTDGSFWVHVRLDPNEEGKIFGKVVGSRVERLDSHDIPEIEDQETLTGYSIRIR